MSDLTIEQKVDGVGGEKPNKLVNYRLNPFN